MKPALWLVLVLLSGCGQGPSSQAETLPLPLPPSPPACTPAISAAPPQPVVSVAEKYAAVSRQAVAAVTAPDATPEYVREVHVADTAARKALVVLEHEGRRPTPTALKQARDAVGALRAALETAP